LALSKPQTKSGRQPIETISHQGKLLCILIPADPAPETTEFYTSPAAPLQVGKIVYSAGSTISRHSHPDNGRQITVTSEVLLVQKGRMIVDIYAEDHTLLCSRQMSTGDVVVFSAGAHGFHFLEDTVLLEVKQGPYDGDKDKEVF
jgi:quercetin dioxygenase-like cupin family protein